MNTVKTTLSPEFQSWLQAEKKKGLVDIKASVDVVASDKLSASVIADELMNAHIKAHAPDYKPLPRNAM